MMPIDSTRIYTTTNTPLVIAHRGGGNEYPENSLAAFTAMKNAGFRYIETDCQATKDGVAVLSHDPALERTTDAHGSISDYTWAELAHVRDHSGNPLMRVDDVLDAFSDLVFNIDAKAYSAAEPLVEALRRTNATARVCVSSFNERRLRRIRAVLPEVTTSLGVSAIARLMLASQLSGSLRAAALRLVPGPDIGVEAAQVPLRSYGVPVLTPALVAAAHDRGLAVHAWTVNDVDTARELVEWGVDGIITDEPNAMREALGSE
ncbi:glycerophosphodiester phosphodiesterase [Arcanobacterium haemolyticum]|nr:glycerophosphodiester phosphodiesterase [Arcanobacterium haemolyticum]